MTENNILTAIQAIVKHTDLTINNVTDGKNRMNSMGEGFEAYIKDAFADTLAETDEVIKLQKISKTFSYTSNKTNPPDMMLWDSDAIEVKKIESEMSNLQLNSSYPKSKLLVTNSKINQACRICEKWEQKDIIYAVGSIKQKQLRSLWMVYGDCYAADDEIYKKVEHKINNAINQLDDLEINQTTNELSGVKNVDPLNITYLRVRGMWIIENPAKVYSYLYHFEKTSTFQLIALMRKTKYETFPVKDRNTLEQMDEVNIQDVKIKNPNNPANLIDAKLIVFKVV